MPLEALTCGESSLVSVLKGWHRRSDIDELSQDDVERLIGAVLAARQVQAVDPGRYVAVCLQRGVKDFWRAKARQLVARSLSPLEVTP